MIAHFIERRLPWLARLMGAGQAPAAPALRWTRDGSSVFRAGQYAIVDDWIDPEVRVQVNGQHLAHGFDSVAEAKGWCEARNNPV